MKKTIDFQRLTISSDCLKSILFILLTLCGATLSAQQKIIQLNLYKGAPPGSENWSWKEKETHKNPLNTRIAYNVTHPTLTAFLPDSSIANGTAVIVCPGGGYQILLMDWEGVDIAHWLNQKGIAAFVLKYRTKHLLTDDPWDEHVKNIRSKTFYKDIAPMLKFELEDAKAAISYIREHAVEYGIHKERVGIMGFSAGGTLAANLAYNYTLSSRPNFAVPIYARVNHIEQPGVPKDAPPLFIVAASNDSLVPSANSVHLYTDWLTAKRSAELHLFSNGGHGFGLGKQNPPVDDWPDLLMKWLKVQGMLNPKK